MTLQNNAQEINNVPISYWQDSVSGLVIMRNYQAQVTMGGVNYNFHVGKLIFDGTKYFAYLDGALVYISPADVGSQSLWLGHPLLSVVQPWSAFKIDYINVTQP